MIIHIQEMVYARDFLLAPGRPRVEHLDAAERQVTLSGYGCPL